jgi:hypothetical protein
MPLWIRRYLTLLPIGFLILIALDPSAGAADTAQTLPDPTGQWALNLGNRTIFVLSISLSGGSQPFSGWFAHPQHFQANGSMELFSHVEGPSEAVRLAALGHKMRAAMRSSETRLVVRALLLRNPDPRSVVQFAEVPDRYRGASIEP